MLGMAGATSAQHPGTVENSQSQATVREEFSRGSFILSKNCMTHGSRIVRHRTATRGVQDHDIHETTKRRRGCSTREQQARTCGERVKALVKQIDWFEREESDGSTSASRCDVTDSGEYAADQYINIDHLRCFCGW